LLEKIYFTAIAPIIIGDGPFIVVGNSIGELTAFQVAKNQITLKKTFGKGTALITGLDGGLKGQSIVSSDANGSIQVWSSSFEHKVEIFVEQYGSLTVG
jgi:hypothetical protein